MALARRYVAIAHRYVAIAQRYAICRSSYATHYLDLYATTHLSAAWAYWAQTSSSDYAHACAREFGAIRYGPRAERFPRWRFFAIAQRYALSRNPYAIHHCDPLSLPEAAWAQASSSLTLPVSFGIYCGTWHHFQWRGELRR